MTFHRQASRYSVTRSAEILLLMFHILSNYRHKKLSGEKYFELFLECMFLDIFAAGPKRFRSHCQGCQIFLGATYQNAARHSDHRFRLRNWRSRVRIPPGCKVFRSLLSPAEWAFYSIVRRRESESGSQKFCCEQNRIFYKVSNFPLNQKKRPDGKIIIINFLVTKKTTSHIFKLAARGKLAPTY
jgi:hypothetical protein